MSEMAELESRVEVATASASSEREPNLEFAPQDLARPTQKTSQIYAFLNHSTATVSDNLPPKVDDKSLARQRRRRTRCVQHHPSLR